MILITVPLREWNLRSDLSRKVTAKERNGYRRAVASRLLFGFIEAVTCGG